MLRQRCSLYIDDRGGMCQLPRPPQGDETTPVCYMTPLICVALGTFLAIDKSEFIPTQSLYFLGFLFNTKNCTVSVPPEKYESTMKLIEEFESETDKMVDVKKLEKIRVSLTTVNFDIKYIIKICIIYVCRVF